MTDSKQDMEKGSNKAESVQSCDSCHMIYIEAKLGQKLYYYLIVAYFTMHLQ
jgi:hypothetical protein